MTFRFNLELPITQNLESEIISKAFLSFVNMFLNIFVFLNLVIGMSILNLSSAYNDCDIY